MEEIILPALVVVGGWLLGVIGFFRAGKARREVEMLRQSVILLSQRLAAAPDAPPAVPAAAPPPVPEVAEAAPPPGPELQAAEPSAPEPPPPGPALPEPKRDLEAVLTQRWGIWLGSAALLLAGVFLIRYAAEQGLLGPAARCFGAALLGAALLAAAEFMRRHPPPALAGSFAVDQAPGALAAGGAAVLFGAAYGFGPFYGLVPPVVGFMLMAAAAMAGLLASLRFGQLTAAVGVAAAFGTPALVSSTAPDMGSLFAYLLAVSAACFGVMRWTAWTWLGWVASLAGAFWVLIAADFPDQAWAPGLFVPLAVLLNLVLLPAPALDHALGRRMAWLPMLALGAAGLVLEGAAPGLAARAGMFLLSPIAVWKGWAEPRLVRLPWGAAGLGLLALLVWALPAWQPTGEEITVEGVVQAVIPGAWAPEALVPFLSAAAAFAVFHALCGLWQERRANPLDWASLPAAVPVLTLAVAYVQVARFQPDLAWAAAALALAAGLVFTAHLAVREGSLERAGVHGAGAAAALSLAYAIVLRDAWLTLAISLFVPALAWIAERSGVRGLRKVALVAATVVLVRLLPNWNVLFYPFGSLPVVNGLVAAYAVPAAAFAWAAMRFRRVADDLLVAVLEAGAVTLFAAFVVLEVRHAATGGSMLGDAEFAEVAFDLTFLAVQARAHLYLHRRTGRRVLGWAWRIEGTLALLLGAVLLLVNPLVTNDRAGAVALAAGYLVPGILAALAMRQVAAGRLLAVYAGLAGFAWITLQIRMLFHPAAPSLERSPVEAAELWAWSGAWLAYGAGLLAAGMWRGERALRQAGLAVVGLVAAKVFLWDMSDLDGLWRVVSFLGLGLALIGLGAAYRRFVLPAKE